MEHPTRAIISLITVLIIGFHMNDLIERTAAGLRMMQKKPDAFLCCFDEGMAWDEPTILGIPVFHSAFINNTMTDSNIPFIPIWYRESDYGVDRKRFNDVFSDT